jgi:hypothetical protein
LRKYLFAEEGANAAPDQKPAVEFVKVPEEAQLPPKQQEPAKIITKSAPI